MVRLAEKPTFTRSNRLFDPRVSTPFSKHNTCDCGEEYEYTGDLLSEREEIDGKEMYRIDYWCPRCGAHLWAQSRYEGPAPVETHHGTELH